MNRFVILQRLCGGQSRVVSLLPLDLVTALRTHSFMQSSFPRLRFEVVPYTRSIRSSMSSAKSLAPAKPSAIAAMKSAIKHFLQLPFPGK